MTGHDPLRLVHDPVLFCTDTIANRHGDPIRSTLPGLEIVQLTGSERVEPDDLERITLAFFSGDAYPDRAANLMQVCLQAPRLEWLHTFSAGVDHPVFRSFTDRGVAITTSSGATASPIAQTVMMYLLALTRELPSWLTAQAEHRWAPHGIRELEGMTVGVLGMGPIGLEVLRLAEAFGMRALGVRRRVRDDEDFETWPVDRLGEVVAELDALVVAAPLTDETRGLIDADVLAALPAGALLVNVGRGEIVDEAALAGSLRSGHLGGAALDVFTSEPLPAESELWDLPNVIITPHSSGDSDRSDERVAEIFIDNLARIADGRPLRHRV